MKALSVLFFLRVTVIYIWQGTKGFNGRGKMVEGTKCVKMQFLYSSHITELTYPTSFTNWSLNSHHKGQGFYSNTFFVRFRNTSGLCLLETEMHKSMVCFNVSVTKSESQQRPARRNR